MIRTYERSGFSPGKQVNVGDKERKGSMIGGAALALSGLKRLSQGRYLGGLTMLAAGSMLWYRGKTGHCNIYESMGVDTAHGTGGLQLQKIVTINRTPQQVYDFWRDLENLPRFMQHLDSVRITGPRTSHWKAVGTGGVTVEWDAEIIQEVPGEQIGWQSIGVADIPNQGTVRFQEAPGNRGTELTVIISYQPPGGAAGKVAANFLKGINAQQLEEDLKRLKQILETGETARVQAAAS